MKLETHLEALLFLHSEPISATKIAKLLDIKKEEVKAIVENLKKRLDQGSGLTLVSDGQSWQLVTRQEFAPLVEQITKKELSEELTPATLETLAIIAYKGPISRVKIEHLRGINSVFTLRKLLMRGLVIYEKDLYRVSFDLLKKTGLTDLNQLPEYQKYKELKLIDEG